MTMKQFDSVLQARMSTDMDLKVAQDQKNETQRLRMISIAKSMSLRSLQMPELKDLQTLLAYQAYLFNKKNNGFANDADIYLGLYTVAKQYGNVNYKTFTGHNGQIKSVAFVPGKKEFFTSGSDGKVLKWNLDNKEQSFQIIYSNSEIIEVLAVSPGADWLACGGENSGIRMIPVKGNNIGYELKGHTGKIKSLIFSYDGKYLYSAAMDGKVLKWNLSAKTSTDLATDMMQITSIDLSSDGKYFAGISNEGKALVWNPEISSDKFRIESPGKVIRTIKFKPDEELVAVGYNDGIVELWDVASRKKISEVKAHSGDVTNIRFNSRLLQMATAGNDGILRLWDTNDLTNTPISFNDNGGLVITFEFSPNGEMIISGSVEGKNNLIGRPTLVDALAVEVCSSVTRNFTEEEWLAYVGRDINYEKTCPGADLKIKIKEVR
jgi:WD40 repeat protein